MPRTKQRVTVRSDLKGYVWRGRSVDGFADVRDLPAAERVAIARMARAYAPSRLTEEQRRLLAQDEARPRRASARLHGFTANTLEDEEAYKAGLYDRLSAHERTAIDNAAFPMSVGGLARLVGVTARQVRHWSDLRLLPVHRSAGDRRYFSAAAVRTALLKRLTRQEIATLASLARRSPRAATLVPMLSTALASLAHQVRRPQAQRDLADAAALLQHAGMEMTRAS